jgi:hypothetical protein
MRRRARDDEAWRAGSGRDRQLAPRGNDALLEPLGPIAPDALDAAIEAARREPVGVYTFAILEVAAGAMEQFPSCSRSPRTSSRSSLRGVRSPATRISSSICGRATSGPDRYQPADDRAARFSDRCARSRRASAWCVSRRFPIRRCDEARGFFVARRPVIGVMGAGEDAVARRSRARRGAGPVDRLPKDGRCSPAGATRV